MLNFDMTRRQILIIAALCSLVLHAILLYQSPTFWREYLAENLTTPSKQKMVVVRKRPKQKEVEPPAPKEEVGQIVELAKPELEEKPKEADYLAENDHTTKEETAAKNFTVNPEVIAPEYSPTQEMKYEDAIDVNATEHSTGAKVGNDKWKPNRDGRLFSFPSPYTQTNKDGLQKPTLASSTSQSLSGAPNNDLLREKEANRTELNAHAYKYASYMNQIRRLVNFYWQQKLDNLNEPLLQQEYTTVVVVSLDAKGNLHSIEVSHSSGSVGVDACVTDAFVLAGPYPEPPELLVQDGLVQLPDFGFTLNVSGPKMNYGGVDPRAGVRFPGILKAPR